MAVGLEGNAAGVALKSGINLYDRVLSSRMRLAAPLAGYPGVRLIGRSVRDALSHPGVQLEALKALEERLKPDIVFTLMDVTVEADALGLGVRFFEKKPPSLAAKLLFDLDGFSDLDVPDPERSGRMPVFLRVAEALSENEDRMCGAFVTGPLTLLSQLLGMNEVLACLRSGEPLQDPLVFALEVVGEYAASLASRADLVVVVEPAAGSLQPWEYRHFCRPYIGGLAGIIRSAGAECLLHICGNVSRLLGEIALSGVGGVILSRQVDLPREAEKLPSNLLLLGNIDPTMVLQHGTVEEVRREVRRLLRHMEGTRNFILSTGCDVPVDVPVRNLEAMMSEVCGWRPRSILI